jgi:hypothetical protein
MALCARLRHLLRKYSYQELPFVAIVEHQHPQDRPHHQWAPGRLQPDIRRAFSSVFGPLFCRRSAQASPLRQRSRLPNQLYDLVYASH